MATFISGSLAGPRRQQDCARQVLSELPLMLKLANVQNKLEFLKFIQEQSETPAFSHRNNSTPFNETPAWRNTKVCNDNQLIAALAVLAAYDPILHRLWWEIGDLVEVVNRLVNELAADQPPPFDVAEIHYAETFRSELLRRIIRP